MRFFLRKQNRLTHEKDITLLFSSGKSLFVYPVKLIYGLTDLTPDNSSFKVMVVASKRNFKRAVKRNLVKRKLREVFRLNVHSIVDSIPSGKKLNIALVYISKDISETVLIEAAELELLDKLKSKLESYHGAKP